METEKAYYVPMLGNDHRGEPAEILGVCMLADEPNVEMSPYLKLQFLDGGISYAPMCGSIYAARIITESDLRAGRIPKPYPPNVSLYAQGD